MKTFENSSRAYKQIGLVLAEAPEGTARRSKSGDPKKRQNPAGNAEGEQGMLGKGLTTKDGKLDAESVQHNMKANMNSQNAKGSGNKARRRLAALQNSSRAYKQIGLVLAEAMGHRVDEIAPLAPLAALGAGARVVAGVAAKGVGAAARLAAQGAKSGARLAAKGAKFGAKSLAKGTKSAAVGARNMAVDAGKDKLISKAQKKADDELTAPSNSDTDLEEGKAIEGTKTALRVAGLAPGVGIAPDAAAGAITLTQRAAAKDPERKKELNRELAGDALAMIPGAGQATRGAQFAAKTGKLIKGTKKAGGGSKLRGRAGAATRKHGAKVYAAGEQAVVNKLRGAKAQSNSDTDLEEGKIMNNAYSVYSRLGHIFLEGRAEKAEASREARKRERDQVLANTLPDGTQKKGSWNWRREGTKETVRKGVKRFKKNSQTNDG